MLHLALSKDIIKEYQGQILLKKASTLHSQGLESSGSICQAKKHDRKRETWSNNVCHQHLTEQFFNLSFGNGDIYMALYLKFEPLVLSLHFLAIEIG